MVSIFPEASALPPLGPPPLAPRDPRFVHGPAELCQLAGTWNGQPLPHGDWAIEEKVDGIRMLWIGDGCGGGEIVTRNGEPFDAAEHLRPELERLQRRFGMPMMFDGEYFEEGGFLPTLSAFRKGTGTGRFYWFDAMPTVYWTIGTSNSGKFRRVTMEASLDEWAPDGIVLAPQRHVVEGEDLQRLAEWFWAQGKEGMVLKDMAAPYVRGRRPTWLKVKRELELRAALDEVLEDGAAAKVLYEGRRLRVAVPTHLRGTLCEGRAVWVKAMEWTETGRLRQGRIVGEAAEAPPMTGRDRT